MNFAFCELIGQDADTIVGSPLTALLHDTSANGHEDTVALLDLVYSTGTAEFGVDLACLVGADDALPLRCAGWPILDDRDRPRGLLLKVSTPIVGMSTGQAEVHSAVDLRDVNEQLLVAGLKAQAQAEIDITVKNEAEAALKLRDEFISIAAHELRTPVTGIKTTAQLALRTLEEAKPYKELAIQQYLLGIVTGANSLVVLMNDLMDVSRMQSGEMLLSVTPIDLVPLVRSTR